MTRTAEYHAACGQGCQGRGCTDQFIYGGLRAELERLNRDCLAEHERHKQAEAECERLRHAVNGLAGELEELRSLVLDWHQAVTPGERTDAIRALAAEAERLGSSNGSPTSG